MNLLLDTHPFLWFAGRAQAANLPPATKDVLEDKANDVFLSFASVWELTIKVSMRKLAIKESVKALVEFHLTNNAINSLPIALIHLDRLEAMPFHHKDPFDRLLIAQAQAENFTLVSTDTTFDLYGIRRIWLK